MRPILALTLLAVPVGAVSGQTAVTYGSRELANAVANVANRPETKSEAEARERKLADDETKRVKVTAQASRPWNLLRGTTQARLIATSPLRIWVQTKNNEVIEEQKWVLSRDDRLVAWRQSLSAAKKSKVKWPAESLKKPEH